MRCVRYCCFDEPTQELVRKIYAKKDFKNAFIIYEYTDDDSYIICGYISVKRKNMTESRFFNRLHSITLANAKHNIEEDVLGVKCYCITDMAFERRLSKEEMKLVLKVIAFSCADEHKKVVLWKEHDGRLLFYPIGPKANENWDNPPFIPYFMDNLCALAK